MILCLLDIHAETESARPWTNTPVSMEISENVCYFSMASREITNMPIFPCADSLIDLGTSENSRFRSITDFEAFARFRGQLNPASSQVRKQFYECLVEMLKLLPDHIGIAYAEGFRPLKVQKTYFDTKMRQILQTIPDKNEAYAETCKHVSPFINNIPTHSTGAAIDMTLFKINEDGTSTLLDMGMFGTIFGPNNQQETFSDNTTEDQRQNRLMLLDAAIRCGLVNYGYEWWHYSFGDCTYALIKNKPGAIYGLVVDVDPNDPIPTTIDAYLASFDLPRE